MIVEGEKFVGQFQGVPYVDAGAKAEVKLADGTVMPLPVKTVSNTVPPECETLGVYEIEYEAFGPSCTCCGCKAKATPPHGMRVAAKRCVEIGRFMLANQPRPL